MKFKTFMAKEPKHTNTVISVGWSNSEEVYSCSDDHTLLKWNLLSGETVLVATLPYDFFPTCLHCFPRISSSSGMTTTAAGKQVMDTLLLTSADGRFFIINKSGRVEKKVDAHSGAILSGQWSPDGAGILTSGEDGHIRVWSRSGMLRSTVVQSTPGTMYAKWGAQGQSIIHTIGKCIAVKPLAANTKGLKWRAHDSLLTCLSYNSSNLLVVSGAEDGRYKLWTLQGRQLFSSAAQQSPVSCVEWAPGGDAFAVGGYNSLRLCDMAGWSHSLTKPTTGSLYNISWSLDGTQVAAACANGHVVFANIIERQLDCHNLSIKLTTPRVLVINNILDMATEVLELPDRVINMAANMSYVAVATPSQCHLYKVDHWNTPTVVDLREGSGAGILLTENHFVLIERQSLSVYGYNGRLLLTPRWANMQAHQLGTNCVTLGNDMVAVRDLSDQKAIHMFEISASPMSHHGSGSTGSVLKHNVNVQSIALSQGAGSSSLAMLDANKDLFIVSSGENKFFKTGAQVLGMIWCSAANMLAGVQESRLSIWLCPLEASGSQTLLTNTVVENDISQFGNRPTLQSFDRSILSVRRMDGALVAVPVPMHYTVLHEFVVAKQWEKAVRLCRLVTDMNAWWTLAAMSSFHREMEISLEAYAATQSVDRVSFIQHIKDLPPGPQQVSESLLLIGRVSDAETVLLQSGNVTQAVALRIRMHHWERALELSQKHKLDLMTLYKKRQQYLKTFNKGETNETFLKALGNITLTDDTESPRGEEQLHPY